MMRLGFSDQILKFIHSYLNSREFRVRVENCLSSPRPVKSEIPQGSLFGPRRFNLYINDILKADNVHSAMYANDTAIISQHTYNFKIIERLQNYITRLQLWLVAWKIKVNASKSASLLFTKQRCIGSLPNIYIFDQPVPWVTEFKYLGFILDAKLNFSPHIRAALQKAAGMSEMLNCLISRKLGQSNHKVGACGVNNQASAVLAGNELPFVAFSHKTDICGTLRPNRKGLPVSLKSSTLKKGEIIAFQKGKMCVLKWKDEKPLHMLSTFHNADMMEVKAKMGDSVKLKPKAVVFYNNSMGGVDRSDQCLSYYPLLPEINSENTTRRFFDIC
ncbi:RNA-directed DNA polymerase from mobile element jockey [Trichonephila clavipes]|uniref:RNA-directed DNA polymerase from mobile element jockey n=1 Tax=Trichonephila clavipes TaxID=2585209 RepID=A0A8X7BEP6_TRICX|nr:RNA-directed DNA polymerase from mobile element jockey [Trichonephila clavipes]